MKPPDDLNRIRRRSRLTKRFHSAHAYLDRRVVQSCNEFRGGAGIHPEELLFQSFAIFNLSDGKCRGSPHACIGRMKRVVEPGKSAPVSYPAKSDGTPLANLRMCREMQVAGKEIVFSQGPPVFAFEDFGKQPVTFQFIRAQLSPSAPGREEEQGKRES